MSLNKQLNAAMKDEAAAPGDYMKLRKNIKSKKDQKVISKIIKDERRHLRELRKMKKKLKK